VQAASCSRLAPLLAARRRLLQQALDEMPCHIGVGLRSGALRVRILQNACRGEAGVGDVKEAAGRDQVQIAGQVQSKHYPSLGPQS